MTTKAEYREAITAAEAKHERAELAWSIGYGAYLDSLQEPTVKQRAIRSVLKRKIRRTDIKELTAELDYMLLRYEYFNDSPRTVEDAAKLHYKTDWLGGMIYEGVFRKIKHGGFERISDMVEQSLERYIVNQAYASGITFVENTLRWDVNRMFNDYMKGKENSRIAAYRKARYAASKVIQALQEEEFEGEKLDIGWREFQHYHFKEGAKR